MNALLQEQREDDQGNGLVCLDGGEGVTEFESMAVEYGEVLWRWLGVVPTDFKSVKSIH